MQTISNDQRNPDSEPSPSPSLSPSSSHSSSRSRSRDKEIEEEKKTRKNQQKSHNNNALIEGKLYLANIPLSIPQGKIIEEFAKFGRIIDFSFRKKADAQNPYYYGYITLNGKTEAENAMENITKNLNWTVKPFGKDYDEKHLNKNINLNINSFLNKKINYQNKQEENLSSDSKNIILNNKLNINLKNVINVREIYITNLPLSTDESKLYKEFFVYGEISKIELKTFWDKKNAFIKYRLIQSAIKALNMENNIYFNGNIINVSYSNENQRKDIKGNENGFELNENKCKLIVVCLNKNLETTDEENILNIFENFGKIKNICIKNINKRIHIFIEYYKYEDAQKSIIEMNKDINIEKRKMLGDENCEIDFYFKSQFNEINPFSIQVNNNMNNKLLPNVQNNNNLNGQIGNGQTLMLQLLQKNLMNNQFNTNLLYNNINNNIQKPNQINLMQYGNMNNNNLFSRNNYNNNNLINNQLNYFNLTNQLLNLIKNNSNKSTSTSKNIFPCNNPSYFPNFNGLNFPQNSQNLNQNQNNLSLSLLLNNPVFSNITNNNFRNQINYNNNNTNNNVVPKTNNNNNVTTNSNNNKLNDVKDILNKIMLDKSKKKSNSNSDSDISSLNSNKSVEEMDFEKEYSLEEENLKYIWNGYLTKNYKEKVNIDIYKIRGKIDDNYFTGYHFNICNRIHYEEVLKKYLLGIVAISPNNITQKENFDKYINYFDEKQRCGVINISEKYILYMAAPGEFSKKFYVNPKKHLLGLLVDSSVEPNLYVNLALPPPVISLTEKRRLMNKKRKNDNKKNSCFGKKSNYHENESEKDMIMKLKEQLKNDDNE